MRSDTRAKSHSLLPAMILGLILLAVHGAIFGAEFRTRDIVTDLELHAKIVRVAIEEHTFPGNFLFYLTSAVGAGFGTSDLAIKVSMTVVLAGSVALKYAASVALAARESAAGMAPTGLVVAVALLSFAFSLPTSEVYLGQIPPNVWHNSTTIFLMPFALVLFGVSAQYLRDGERRWLWAMLLAAAFNVAAKPSLLFALLVVFPIFAMVRFRLARRSWEALGATAVMGVFVLIQYVYTFKSGSTEAVYQAGNFGVSGESHVRVQFLHVWRYYSDSILLSLAASFAFPVVALAAYRRRLLDDDLVRYALALAGAGIGVFAVLTETGVREFHGNFIWQAIVANYILFLVTLIRIWPLLDFARDRIRSSLVAVAFSAHVVAGLYFLAYYFSNRTYF